MKKLLSKLILIALFLVPLLMMGNKTCRAAWAPMVSGTSENLSAVWGSSGSDVFAVGFNGTILHYDGTSWSPMDSGTSQSLMAVWGSSGSDVFAVGYNSTILHYDGTSWSPMPNPGTALLAGVWGSSASDVFAVGLYGTILHYNGSTWSPMESGTTRWLVDVWGSSGSDVFAVGDHGFMFHYDGFEWSFITDIISVYSLAGVWGSSGSNVFVVGTDGVIVNYDGLNWNYMMSGLSVAFQGVWGSSGTNVFVVGLNGIILSYDGFGWTPMVSGSSDDLTAVWGSSGSDVFALGNNGTILHYAGMEPACSVILIPSSVTLYTWEFFQFGTTVDGICNEPCFTWELSLQESTGSAINQNGLYTAGGNAGIDIVQVTDLCNGNIAANAIVDVIASTTTTTIISTTTTTAPPGKPDKYTYKISSTGADMQMYTCSGCGCSSVYFTVAERIQKDGPGAPVRNTPAGYLEINSYNDCTGSYRYGYGDIELSAFNVSKQLDSAYAEGSGIIYGWAREDYDDTTEEPFTESVSIQVAWTGIGDLYTGRYKYTDRYSYPGGISVRYTQSSNGGTRDASAVGLLQGEATAIDLISDYAMIFDFSGGEIQIVKYPKTVSSRSRNYCLGNFDGDHDVDGSDALIFKADFGRSSIKNPCPNF